MATSSNQTTAKKPIWIQKTKLNAVFSPGSCAGKPCPLRMPIVMAIAGAATKDAIQPKAAAMKAEMTQRGPRPSGSGTKEITIPKSAA